MLGRLDEIADGVYRLGTDWVGWYLCDVDGAVTVVDLDEPPLRLLPGSFTSRARTT